MDVGLSRNVFWYVVVLLMLGGSLVNGMRCHLCEDSPSNEECNTNVAECSSQGNNGCYTRLERLESVGKRYTKGCMNYEECVKLEELNHRKYCPFTPSKCTYCCKDKTNCNAFNNAHGHTHAYTVTALTFMTTLVIGYYLT